jgi:hypothetical protein
MGDYRAYVIGKDSHRFLKVAEFLSDHSNDTVAMNAAKKFVDAHDVELWDAGRLVCRFSTEEKPQTLKQFTIDTISVAPNVLVVQTVREPA